MSKFNRGDRVFSIDPRRDHNDHDTPYIVERVIGVDPDTGAPEHYRDADILRLGSSLRVGDYVLAADDNSGKRHTASASFVVAAPGTSEELDLEGYESPPREDHLRRYSVSLITQGKFKLYTLTMPSAVLAETCFVTTRDEDPIAGFQRVLDERRAQEIAEYIDGGFGSIPNSIVLSAQEEAKVELVGKGKTLQFVNDPKAFLVLDGQHRVYGFSKARTNLRVPVVIYNGLTRAEETRLFIDINTKQQPVPRELLLDIKHLAEIENAFEKKLREIFDRFNTDSLSALKGLLSPSAKKTGQISRVTFNSALKPLSAVFEGHENILIYTILNDYFLAVNYGLLQIDELASLTNPTIFRAFTDLFKDVVLQRVQDRFDRKYTKDNFYTVLAPLFVSNRNILWKSPGNSYKKMAAEMAATIRPKLTL